MSPNSALRTANAAELRFVAAILNSSASEREALEAVLVSNGELWNQCNPREIAKDAFLRMDEAARESFLNHLRREAHKYSVRYRHSTVKQLFKSPSRLEAYLLAQAAIGALSARLLLPLPFMSYTGMCGALTPDAIQVWAMTMDLIDTNPAAEIEKPSSEGAIRLYILTAQEEARSMEAAQARSQSLADIFQLILLQGMRPDEVISLMKSDVSIAKRSIQITSGKTLSARRTLLMRSASAPIITRRLAEKDGSLYLFPALRQGKLGSGHISLSGLENCHNDVLESLRTDEASPIDIPCVIYDARHTFATRAAEKGMPLGTLAAILGHSGLRAVMKYVHPTQSHQFEEMKKLDA